MMNEISMKRPALFLLEFTLFLLVAGLTGFAQEGETIIQQKRMAFTRLRESGLSRDEAETFSMYLQIALIDATKWEIMDFSVTKALIVERGGMENCTSLQCEIINGQLLSVDYMCFGSIETIGRTFSLNVQVADVTSGRTVANVSKFFKGKEKVFISKIIPQVARQVATAILGRKEVAKSRGKETPASLESVIEQRASQSFSDVRGYLSYGSDSDIETTGKLAFGYFVTGRNMVPDDALRYSYQLQSYLADVGACAMLYIDEMERLMQLRGGNLQCGKMKCAMNVGRLLGVDYMGYGKIRKFFGQFIIRAYIIDVDNGTILIKEKRRFRGREIVFLTEVIPQLAYRLGEVLERKVNKGGY
jgi:TolB-like protein